MALQEFIDLITKPAKTLIRKPVLFVPALFILIIFAFLLRISDQVNVSLATNNMNSTPILTAWVVFFVILSFIILSLVLSGIIGMNRNYLSMKNYSLKEFLSDMRKYWFKNFVILILILLISRAIFFISLFLARGIGQTLTLNVQIAQVIFLILMFIGFAGFLMFFTFARFYLVLRNQGIKQSIKSSFATVKARYLETLSLVVLFFVISELVDLTSKLHAILPDLLKTLIILPYLVLVLTYFVLKFDQLSKLTDKSSK